MTGDAETQPVEGALSLSDLAENMDEGPEVEEGEEGAESEEEGEEEAQEGEESEEESETEEEEQDPTVVLKHDGKEVPLPLSKVKELAQQGFDYTQKTMALAEERKTVESVKAQADTFRKQNEDSLNQTLARLEAFSTFIEAQVGSPPPVEWASENVAYYLEKKQEYEDRKGQLQQALAATEHVRSEAQRQRQAHINEQASETEKALSDTLPGWNEALMGDLAKYLGTVGITPDKAIDAFVVKGVWELAFKAKAYDALQAEKAKLKPKTELKKVQKPSTSHLPNRADARKVEALKRHKTNPSLNTLTDLMD